MGGPQIEVEQPDDLSTTPISTEPNQSNVPLTVSPEGHASNHDDDQEEEDENPEFEVEHHGSPENLNNYQLARDRSRRVSRPPARYSYSDLVYCALIAGKELRNSEPTTFEEAINSKDCIK